jgi:hypothetical protein
MIVLIFTSFLFEHFYITTCKKKSQNIYILHEQIASAVITLIRDESCFSAINPISAILTLRIFLIINNKLDSIQVPTMANLS